MTAEAAGRLVRTSLREQVTQALRAALVTGEMQAGVVYSAPALAARFGVSATPVREAMLDLAQRGLVEVVRNKGFRVATLGDRDLDEITEIRALLEVPTVVSLAGRLPDGDVAALWQLAAAIEDAAGRGDLAGYVAADRDFHLTLLGLAGNARLVDLVDDLRSRSRLSGLAALARAGTLGPSAREHAELLAALAAGDAAAAEAVMRRHLRHVRGEWAGQPEPRPEPVSAAARAARAASGDGGSTATPSGAAPDRAAAASSSA